MSPLRLVGSFLAAARPHAFEACFAVNAVAVGIAGALFGWGQASSLMHALLPHWLATMLDVTYCASGILIIYGGTRNRTHAELAGLALMASAAAIRAYVGALGIFSGPVMVSEYFGTTSFHLSLMLAAAGRFHSILRGETIVIRQNGGRS